MNDNNNRRRPDSRMQGAGRRTYPDAAHDGPRVGRIERNVPRARQVSADEDYGEQAIPTYTGNSNATLRTPHATLHRGSAYRAPSGPRQYKREMDAETEAVESENLLAGRNPIREALKAGRPVEKLLVAAGELSGAAQEIIRMAREAGAVVQKVDRSRLDQIYPAHQGMLAYVAAVPYVALNDILASAAAKGEDPFLILLDGITDPHNLGAIVRSAECAGAHGVVIPERRAAGLTPAAAKAAAGALNHMPIAIILGYHIAQNFIIFSFSQINTSQCVVMHRGFATIKARLRNRNCIRTTPSPYFQLSSHSGKVCKFIKSCIFQHIITRKHHTCFFCRF